MNKFCFGLFFVIGFLELSVFADSVFVDVSGMSQEQKNLVLSAAYRLVWEDNVKNKPPVSWNASTGEIVWKNAVSNLANIVTTTTLTTKIGSILNVLTNNPVSKPSVFNLNDSENKTYYLWFDTNGNFRMYGQVPSDYNSDGVVIKGVLP